VNGTVSLSLVIHNHQPVGNFGWVIEDVYNHAYEPLIASLERHPRIRLSLHYTGPLLRWLIEQKPEAIERIRNLVGRGQVEIVGGALYEPILVTIPDRDRQGQLRLMRDELERQFGRRPEGAWLAERVWEPSLAWDIAAAGYRWTVLDDNHLRGASIPEDEMWTAFNTDDRGLRLTIFGTEQGLRYRIPFRPVDDLIDYLRARVTPDGRFVGMMGDDGEKLGSWPGTFEYCWSREHWVDRCFDAIEVNSDWLRMVTPSEWLAGHAPTGRAYFPTASYVEMTEWVLPPDENPVFTALLSAARESGDPSARFLRGGLWRNYAARYREINELHKQMLRTSDKVEAMAESPERAVALDHLYQGESNDCYWHGLFGGIYIVHMRMATLAHLIAAEDMADAARSASGGRPYGGRLLDADLDAVDEAVVCTPGQTVIVDVAEGGAISSWDLRASRVALGSVLRRRPEAYHRLLLEQAAHDERAATELAAGELEMAGAATAADGGGANAGQDPGAARPDATPKTIHDIVASREPGLARLLHYDRHERRSGIVHLLPPDQPPGADAFVRVAYRELGDFVEEPYGLDELTDDTVRLSRVGSAAIDGSSVPLRVGKTYRLTGSRTEPLLGLDVELASLAGAPLAVELAVEWNLNLMGGGHNPAAWYETPDGVRSPHDAAGELARASFLAFGNDHEGVRIAAEAQPATRFTWYPVETISNSEAGFERVYQGSSLLFRWPVNLAAGERRTWSMKFRVTETIDWAAVRAPGPGGSA